ncbi:hypothetical protein [Marinomonas sp.]|uniref:hypothetical protein n=1 Tax=Marinomonas sp. TaxID=1904862 RepID=UPI003C7591F9
MASPIDKIFEEIFECEPKKSGTAFEQLAAIATHMLEGGDVVHDDKLRGHFSETLYQLDIHHKSNSSSTMGEAKDYSIRNSKVGRGDLQKLGGALPDLVNVDSGTFFSATGYTKPALKYAESTEKMLGKPITLYGLRPGTEVDEEGFIKTIVITIEIHMPMPEKAKWLPHITESGQSALKVLLKDGQDKIEYKMGLSCFYDSIGREILSLQELTSHGYGVTNADTDMSHACFVLKDHFIDINGVMAEIHGLEYELPYNTFTQELRITDDSGHRFVLLDKDGKVIKFLTDKKLREFEFDDTGKLKKR